LLWADPFDKPADAKSKEFANNNVRNISVMFGLKPAKALLEREKLILIVRAHQPKPKGYEFHKWSGEFPTVITIFSAPNYEHMENDGAVLISTGMSGLNVITF
jgi:hypothetical protein